MSNKQFSNEYLQVEVPSLLVYHIVGPGIIWHRFGQGKPVGLVQVTGRLPFRQVVPAMAKPVTVTDYARDFPILFKNARLL